MPAATPEPDAELYSEKVRGCRAGVAGYTGPGVPQWPARRVWHRSCWQGSSAIKWRRGAWRAQRTAARPPARPPALLPTAGGSSLSATYAEHSMEIGRPSSRKKHDSWDGSEYGEGMEWLQPRPRPSPPPLPPTEQVHDLEHQSPRGFLEQEEAKTGRKPELKMFPKVGRSREAPHALLHALSPYSKFCARAPLPGQR